MNKNTSAAGKQSTISSPRPLQAIIGQHFPYKVVVVGVNTQSGRERHVSGYLYENGDLVIRFLMKEPNLKGPLITEEEVAEGIVALTKVVLPNGETLEGGWRYAPYAPEIADRVKAAIHTLEAASFAYGEGEGSALYQESCQARANLDRLLGLDGQGKSRIVESPKAPAVAPVDNNPVAERLVVTVDQADGHNVLIALAPVGMSKDETSDLVRARASENVEHSDLMQDLGDRGFTVFSNFVTVDID